MYKSLPAIPLLRTRHTAASYHEIPIDLADSRSGEALVRYADFGIACESFYHRADGGNWPYGRAIAGALRDQWGRETLATKLQDANAFLRGFGAELVVYDGYRPIACQRGLWDFFMDQSRRDMPDATEEDRLDFVRTFVSDPTRFAAADPATWPVHSTGGAVDVMLRDLESGQSLDLGTRFDEMTAMAATAYFEEQLEQGAITDTDLRLLHRRLLYAAMTGAGFTNYPHEFWHYDYGDQMYVMYAGSGINAAWYGYIDSPERSA